VFGPRESFAAVIVRRRIAVEEADQVAALESLQDRFRRPVTARELELGEAFIGIEQDQPDHRSVAAQQQQPRWVVHQVVFDQLLLGHELLDVQGYLRVGQESRRVEVEGKAQAREILLKVGLLHLGDMGQQRFQIIGLLLLDEVVDEAGIEQFHGELFVGHAGDHRFARIGVAHLLEELQAVH
jgi:hypothetical protein